MLTIVLLSEEDAHQQDVLQVRLTLGIRINAELAAIVVKDRQLVQFAETGFAHPGRRIAALASVIVHARPGTHV